MKRDKLSPVELKILRDYNSVSSYISPEERVKVAKKYFGFDKKTTSAKKNRKRKLKK